MSLYILPMVNPMAFSTHSYLFLYFLDSFVARVLDMNYVFPIRCVYIIFGRYCDFCHLFW